MFNFNIYLFILVPFVKTLIIAIVIQYIVKFSHYALFGNHTLKLQFNWCTFR